jgi:hypothetical protein
MQNTFFVVVGVLFGVFSMTNGFLLVVCPKNFLRFYDFWSRGDYVGRTASWRKDVERAEWRILGAGFFVIGIAIIWAMLHLGT